jgi:predicted nucleic acid-binding protein
VEKTPVRSAVGNRTALLLRGDKVRLALDQMLTARLPLDGSPVRAEMLDSAGRELADVIAQELEPAGRQEQWLLLPAKDRAGAVRRWIEEADESILFLSVLTLGEIRNGVQRLRSGQRRGRLESWLQVDLPLRFQDRILPIGAAIADRWGRASAIAAARGKPVPVVDGLLAATAIHHNLTLVTRNSADVSGTGVTTLNPWL